MSIRKITLFRLSLAARYQCEIDVSKDLASPQPLLIRPETSTFFHPTDRSGIIKMEKSQQIELFCSHGFASPRGVGKDSLSVGCAYGSKFHLNGTLYNFNEFSCRKYPVYAVQRRANERCFNDSSLVDIGFQVDKRFLTVLTVCHNPSTEQTYYSKYRLAPANVAAQQRFNRPKFNQGDFFSGKDINFLLTRNRQREAISEILKSEEQAEKFVHESGDVFLSRGEIDWNFNYKLASTSYWKLPTFPELGHLAARGDFIYANEQRSTFHYINVSPQVSKVQEESVPVGEL